MSCDTVDDLHAAEDRIGSLHQALTEIIQGGAAPSTFAHLLDDPPFCRPSCYWDNDDERYGCDEDCGCQCAHPLDPDRELD